MNTLKVIINTGCIKDEREACARAVLGSSNGFAARATILKRGKKESFG